MVRFKVKPRRGITEIPCTAELTSLLACFASSGDVSVMRECKVSAEALHRCMAAKPKVGKAPKSSINYLLSKIK